MTTYDQSVVHLVNAPPRAKENPVNVEVERLLTILAVLDRAIVAAKQRGLDPTRLSPDQALQLLEEVS